MGVSAVNGSCVIGHLSLSLKVICVGFLGNLLLGLDLDSVGTRVFK